jgi:chromate transport protein ChrA
VNKNLLINHEVQGSMSPKLRLIQKIVGAYGILSWATFVAVVVLSMTVANNYPTSTNINAWVHGLIVAVTAIPIFKLVARAAQNKRRALMRLRMVLTVIPVAIIAVLFFLPLPTWMDVEQGVCGALLLGALGILIFDPRKTRAQLEFQGVIGGSI